MNLTRNMSPRATVTNVRNDAGRNSVLDGQCLIGGRVDGNQNGFHLYLSQACVPVVFPFQRAPVFKATFVRCIQQVFFLRACHQMRRVATRLVVALVKHVKALVEIVVGYHKGNSMSRRTLAVADCECAIAVRGDACLPRPTFSGSANVYLRPEAFRDWFRFWSPQSHVATITKLVKLSMPNTQEVVYF